MREADTDTFVNSFSTLNKMGDHLNEMILAVGEEVFGTQPLRKPGTRTRTRTHESAVPRRRSHLTAYLQDKADHYRDVFRKTQRQMLRDDSNPALNA
jgi:hypothetical protein